MYAPQIDLSDITKDSLHEKSQRSLQKYQAFCGNWNGHIGKVPFGYAEVFNHQNDWRGRIVEYTMANTWKLQSSDLIEWTHIDYYILPRRGNLTLINNIKVISDKEHVTQHRFLACDFKVILMFATNSILKSDPGYSRSKCVAQIQRWFQWMPEVLPSYEFREMLAKIIK